MASNPYLPPVLSTHPEVAFGTKLPVTFNGSMSEFEGEQVNSLVRGQRQPLKQQNMLTSNQLASFGLLALVIAVFGFESVVYGELDELPSLLLSAVALAAGLGAVYYHHTIRSRLRFDLKHRGEGVFANIAGRVSESGIEYLVEDYTVRYEWQDFVGCRVSRDAAILYLEYPRQLNFVAASLFQTPEQWESAKATIERNLPALGRLARFSARSPSPVVKHITAGVKALDKNDWNTALQEFDRVLKLRPDEAQALKGRAVAISALGDAEATLVAVNEAMQRGVYDTTTRQIRATALTALERYDEALEDLDWLLQRDSQNADWLSGRSLACCKLERYVEAVRDASAALEIRADDPIAFNNRGYARLKLGEIDSAITDLQAAIRLAPDLQRPRELLAEARVLVDQA